MQAAKRTKKYVFLSLVTLTFKLVQVRDQTLLPCEFGANPFSGSGNISYTNKKTQTDGAKNTFHSSLHVLITQKYQDTQNKHKILKPGLVTSYNIQPGNG